MAFVIASMSHVGLSFRQNRTGCNFIGVEVSANPYQAR